MRWNFKPASFIKHIAAGASVVTMCLAPVAQGAAAKSQKQLINEYLKEVGLTTRKMTVGEYWRMVRHVYPTPLRGSMDLWVSLNRQEMMPSVEATSFKDSSGIEQVRLTLSSAGQSMNLTFTGDEEKPLKVNGVSLSQKELLKVKDFNTVAQKLVKKDSSIAKSLKKNPQQSLISKNPILSYEEFKKLSARQKAEYFLRLRQAMESAQRVYQNIYGEQASLEHQRKYEWVWNLVFGVPAEAASSLAGKPCIVAGYLSIYGENGSCGGGKRGSADLQDKMSANNANCSSSSSVACNPMVYGFSKSGSPHCVTRAQVKYATRECNKMSPLRDEDPRQQGENKKRIIETYLKQVKGQDIDLKLNEEGKISEEQYKQISKYLSDLQEYIQSAIAECGQAPLSEIKVKRDDQLSACREIESRAFSLQHFAVNPEPEVAPVPAPPAELPDPNSIDCNADGTGKQLADDKKSCVCPPGSKESNDENDKGMCVKVAGGGAVLPGGDGATPVSAETDCGFWCRNKNWMVPVGVGLVGLGLFWWMFRDKNKANATPPVYIPPAPVPGPVPSPGPNPVTPPVMPPPPAPCPPPASMVNGVCVPQVVVPPPILEGGEGGTRTDAPGRGSGVR